MSYTIELHYIGTAVRKPKAKYHFVDDEKGVHEFIADHLLDIYRQCRRLHPRLKMTSINLVLNKNDKSTWLNIIKNYDKINKEFNKVLSMRPRSCWDTLPDYSC